MKTASSNRPSIWKGLPVGLAVAGISGAVAGFREGGIIGGLGGAIAGAAIGVLLVVAFNFYKRLRASN